MNSLVSTIVDTVCATTGITREQVLSDYRGKLIAQSRLVVYYLCRTHAILGVMSYPEIGKQFGRDHTTIINGVRCVEGKLAARDPWMCTVVDAAMAKMNSDWYQRQASWQ